MSKKKLRSFGLVAACISYSLLLLISTIFPCELVKAEPQNTEQQSMIEPQTAQSNPKYIFIKGKLEEANKLFQKGTAESQQKASEIWEELLSAQRGIDDKRWESLILSEIGVSYREAGDNWKAISYFKQSLRASHAGLDKIGENIASLNIKVTQIKLLEQKDPRAYKEIQEFENQEKKFGISTDIFTNFPLPSNSVGWHPSKE
ncbi:tetratricopeptide repeat protein [Nostoc muscorum FACHB-395]|nr:tetratricopeptide repeat protein [Desmonostoc muscorum FACHB-395]